jgi:hypothetical protein
METEMEIAAGTMILEISPLPRPPRPPPKKNQKKPKKSLPISFFQTKLSNYLSIDAILI